MMQGDLISQSFVERGVFGSTRLQDRPAGSLMWASLKRGDKIICAKLDQMFRSALDALEALPTFKEMGVELHLIDLGGNVCGDGIAKLIFTILSAVAEAERDRIREKVKEVKRFQRS